MYQPVRVTEAPEGAVILDQGLKDFAREWNEAQAMKKDTRCFRYHAENGGRVFVVEDASGEFHAYTRRARDHGYTVHSGFKTKTEANKAAEAIARCLGDPAQYSKKPWLSPARQSEKAIRVFCFRNDNGGSIMVDEDMTGYYFISYRPSRNRESATYLGFKTKTAANEAAEAMVPRLLGNEAKEKGATASVSAFAIAPFASQGNPQLAIAG